MGLEKASEFWKENSDKFDAILLTDDGELYVTEGISDEFTSDLEINLIRR
jgi:thiamine biosynthesis lipoprotein